MYIDYLIYHPFTKPELFLKNKYHFNASVLDVASGGVLSVYRSVSLIMALSSKSSTPHFLIASIETACQSLNGWRAQSSSFKTRSSEPLNNSNFPYRQKSSAFMPEIFKNSIAVVGMLKDKAMRETVAALLPLIQTWYVCDLSSSE